MRKRKNYPASLVKTAVTWAGGQQALALRYQQLGFRTVRQNTILKWLGRAGFPPEWAEATELATQGVVKARDIVAACQRRPKRAA